MLADPTFPPHLEQIMNQAAQLLARLQEPGIDILSHSIPSGPDRPASVEAFRPVAQTTVSLEGDSNVILPVSSVGQTLEVDPTLYDQHTANVTAVIEYRTAAIQSLIELISRHAQESEVPE